MISILKGYLKKLTNLTSANKSLMQLRLFASQDLDLNELDFLDGVSSFEILRKVMSRSGVDYPLVDLLDSRNESVNKVSKRLKNILRKSEFIFEERGAQDLYLGWPYVEGKFQDDTKLRCPLLFIPVKLSVKKDKWVIRRKKNVSISINKSFILAYAYYNKVSIQDDLVEATFDDFSSDLQEFRNQLYEFFKDSPIEINFNQDLFKDNLVKFVDYKKDEYEHQYRTGEMKLQPTAVLGLFPQAGSYLIPDYENILKKNEFESLEDFFFSKQLDQSQSGSNHAFKYLKEVREDQTYAPYKLDAFQENAVKAVKRGNSLVVHGPPGTGKSQLICNLISDNISRGNRVLVVCQKRAALDVVYKRLQEKELDEFAVVVHDFKSDRKEIYTKLNNQIENLKEFEQKNNSLDSIFLEREFLQESRKIDQITEELDEFRDALFGEDNSGFSAKELYLRTDKKNLNEGISVEFRHFNKDHEAKFIESLEEFYVYANQFAKTEHPWNDRVSFKEFGLEDYQKIKGIITEVPSKVNDFIRKSLAILSDPITYLDHVWINDREVELRDLMNLIKSPTVYRNYRHMFNEKPDRDWLLLREKRILDLFKGAGVDVSVDKNELGVFRDRLEKYRVVRQNVFKHIFWKLFNKEKRPIKKALVENGLKWNKKGIAALVVKIDNRLNLEHNLTQLRNKEWVLEVTDSLKMEDIQSCFDKLNIALEAIELTKDLRSFIQYFSIQNITANEFLEKADGVLKLCKELSLQSLDWRKYLTPKQVLRLTEEPDYLTRAQSTLDSDFDSICDYDRLLDNWDENQISTAFDLLEEFEDVELAKKTFLNINGLAWLNLLEIKYPILRTVSSQQMTKKEKELRKSLQSKLKICKEIVLQKLRENTYKGVEYNRLRNRITYRELQHQLTKNRKIWPLRKTIENFSNEIFDLIPCWMASPESVSAVFPLQEKFDLVIFDEASQCFSEKGIPSIYRAKQVVITGDNQQLAPNDLYQARWEEDDEIPDLEIDSLLDLGIKYFQQVELLGHYRSQSLDLINFSNKHFYKGRLRLLPDFRRVLEKTPGIEYLKVDGLWQNNTNEVEADRIVNLVQELIENGEKNLGVVTFNFKQQSLIQDKLEEMAIQNEVILPKSLFVKNIENVQGDERDVIIFSIGYAANLKGKVGSHFGSLNMERGENRLNVAISRARKKSYVVASILPTELNVEDSKYRGPKLFKEYLEYALEVSNGNFQVEKEKETFSESWYLKHHLEERLKSYENVKISENMPFADLTIAKDDIYKGLILTDDNRYYEAVSTKDWHAYLPMMLREKKWKFHKVHSREFWNDETKVLRDFEKLIE